jgi:ubiquinone biosynthesis protein UbiJ
MTARDLGYAALETALNGYLRLDPAAARRIADLHGRVVGLEVLGLGLAMYLVPDETGGLQVLPPSDSPPDCWLRGTPLDLARSGDLRAGAGRIFEGRVRVEGDTALAQRFGTILAELDVDWEEQLSRLTGDVVAHEVGRVAGAAGDYAARGRETLEQNLREYLQEEARVLPTRLEVQEFLDAVDVLRDDVERLGARVERLQRHAGKAGDTE